ncbi:peptidylprolyl isomerase [Sulfurimonas aquatica]|uniref:Peptidyl-prolyl cis-trans isomerase n=1 Tax=Sulfurimonas aquatica TaxID=2672570 RepID=A0A975B1J2_9BACT|nr:peptidylprolyl isomerase [Sulfurimonas aquatica]QSZ42494.1 peptidylprolyl isomerase [Sulfurimonas aquatica]
MHKILISLLFLLNLNLSAQNTHVVLETTQGNIEIELYNDIAPLAVENFTTHIKNGYYNGIAFHRIIRNFMIQGGDPTESGRGGESIWKKDFKDEFKNKVFDKPGILAMANRGPATNGSQFFITTAPTPWLNGNHTIFGHITEASMVPLFKLNNVATDRRDRPQERQEIIKAYIKESKGK